MSWYKSKAAKHPQEMQVPLPRFLGEQDGTPEREFKDRLIDFFQRDQSVQTAYLARVAYGEGASVSVALCLRTQFGPDRGMAEKIGKIFAVMFGAHEHLDMLFLSAEQEAELSMSCKAFWETGNKETHRSA